MKNLKMTLAAIMIALFAVMGTNNVAKAQTSNDVLLAAGNLVNLQVDVGNIDVDVNDVITIGDITITDVVDVTNVLNNNNINILRDILNNNTVTIDNVLNNLLRDADILNNNQVVVGILNGQLLVARQFGIRP